MIENPTVTKSKGTALCELIFLPKRELKLYISNKEIATNETINVLTFLS